MSTGVPAEDIAFIPSTIDDYRLLADVFDAMWPIDPMDPERTRLWYSDSGRIWDRFLVQAAGQPVGCAIGVHWPWEQAPDRVSDVHVALLPEYLDAARLTAAYDFAEAQQRAAGARAVLAHIPESDTLTTRVLAGRGYEVDRRERFWELDIPAHFDRLRSMAEASRRRLAEAGMTITTLAERSGPEMLERLHAMSAAAELDVPTSSTHVPDSFEKFADWLASPNIHSDRIWLALEGDSVAGISVLSYPGERGVVTTDWTAVARDFRNRGIARALKLETILQAADLGVDRIRTDNDFRNLPILHINKDLGYSHLLDWLRLKRTL